MNPPRGPLGVMGGTFDPVHLAHLRLAEEAAETLGLPEIRWVPAGNPGHRTAPRTPARHRLEMVRRAIAGNPRFSLDPAEAALDTPAFTIDTLTRIRGELGPDAPLVFLIGTDQLLAFETWRRWRELFLLAHFAVANRPGFALSIDSLPAALGREYADRAGPPECLARSRAGRIVNFPLTALEISGTEIRARLAAGRSVRYLLPPEVLAYIEANALYRPRA